MNYELLEKELKERLKIEYTWGRKQNNNFDKQTNFIYSINSFHKLQQRIEKDFKSNFNYKELKIHNPWLRENKLNNKSRKVYKIKIPIK